MKNKFINEIAGLILLVSVSAQAGTYFSMQLTNPPPMPFNPFPDLPVYDLGEGRFIYDDRSVDYQALQQAAESSSESAMMDAVLLLEPALPGRSTMLGISSSGSGG